MLEVAIVGGGLGGLALAASLQRDGLQPVVLERAPSWDQSGWGIALWRSGLAVLDELGVGDAVRAQGAGLSRFELRGRAGVLERRVDLDIGMVAIHRTVLHACLRQGVDAGALLLDAEVVEVHEEPDGVLLRLADGRTRSCDVVVGADGVSSTVRAECFDDWRRRQTGEMAWSWWTPEDWRPPEATVEVWHRGREAFVADVGGRAVVNVAAPTGPRLGQDRAEQDGMALLWDTTDLLGWELPHLLDAVEPDEVFSTVTERVVASSWASERCVLIGDAAHAMHPIAGMGATLAMADARCLAQLLACSSAAPGRALAAFERLRRGPVRRAQWLARAGEVLTFSTHPAYARLRHAAVRLTPGLQGVADHLATRSARRAADLPQSQNHGSQPPACRASERPERHARLVSALVASAAAGLVGEEHHCCAAAHASPPSPPAVTTAIAAPRELNLPLARASTADAAVSPPTEAVVRSSVERCSPPARNVAAPTPTCAAPRIRNR